VVIVGTDFSAPAAAAVEKARLLARRLDEEVEIVHVSQCVDPERWEPGAAEREWLDAIGEPAERVTIRRGTPWVELVRIAEERQASMIVVGSHGRSGFQPVALGATVARLALLSSRPTLLVSESPLVRAASPSPRSDELFPTVDRASGKR
jgi:nucleotide-binding universal stress UspA family protein